jgi:hypothetical protein
MELLHPSSARLASRRLERAITLPQSGRTAVGRSKPCLPGSFPPGSSLLIGDGTTRVYASALPARVIPSARRAALTLWRNHPATPTQQHLTFRRRAQRKQVTQSDVLLQALRQARASGRALELPEIMALGIAQHGARLNELRSHAYVIENEMERDSEGRVLSRYWLRFDPERDVSL